MAEAEGPTLSPVAGYVHVLWRRTEMLEDRVDRLYAQSRIFTMSLVLEAGWVHLSDDANRGRWQKVKALIG